MDEVGAPDEAATSQLLAYIKEKYEIFAKLHVARLFWRGVAWVGREKGPVLPKAGECLLKI